MKKKNWIGYSLLIMMSMVMFYQLFRMSVSIMSILVATFLLIGFALAIVLEAISITKEIESIESTILKKQIVSFLFVFLGTFFTYGLATYLFIPVVLASAMVGLLGHIFLRKLEVEVYCGSFAGMSSALILGPGNMIIAGTITGLAYLVTKPVFRGVGGKLGTIALIGTSSTFLIFQKSYSIQILETSIAFIVLFSILGVVITYSIQHKLKQTAVLASSLPTILIGIPTILFVENGGILMSVYFAATFAGMASEKHIQHFIQSVIVGIIVGSIFVISMPCFNGAGGKLGTIAFISVLAFTGYKACYQILVTKIVKSNKVHLKRG